MNGNLQKYLLKVCQLCRKAVSLHLVKPDHYTFIVTSYK